NLVAHELAVKIRGSDLHGVAASNDNPPTAFLPQQELGQPLDVLTIALDIRAFMRQHHRPIHRYGSLPALQRDRERLGRLGAILTIPKHSRNEIRIEWRSEFGMHLCQYISMWLGIDIGTGGSRALLVNERGTVVAGYTAVHEDMRMERPL